MQFKKPASTEVVSVAPPMPIMHRQQSVTSQEEAFWAASAEVDGGTLSTLVETPEADKASTGAAPETVDSAARHRTVRFAMSAGDRAPAAPDSAEAPLLATAPGNGPKIMPPDSSDSDGEVLGSCCSRTRRNCRRVAIVASTAAVATTLGTGGVLLGEYLLDSRESCDGYIHAGIAAAAPIAHSVVDTAGEILGHIGTGAGMLYNVTYDALSAKLAKLSVG